ncbi:hypothetical protein [Pseudomonas aeruginosa]|uniref:hypothetical protein n=1 Tax=Pseudomonas aeruginosa TaxID=287 RepID=UPI0013869C7B|nr:hypothetical protein [Pseudomonas aeruginosa]
MSKISIDLKVGETLAIAGQIKITLKAKSGQLARIEVHAPEGVVVDPPNRKR